MTEKNKKNPPKKLPVTTTKGPKSKQPPKPKFQGGVFSVGVILLIFGVLGLAYNIISGYQTTAAGVLTSETNYFIEISPKILATDSSQQSVLAEMFSHRLWQRFLPEADFSAENYNWVGKKAGFGTTKAGEFVLVKYRSKKKALDFLADRFLLENESFVDEKINGTRIYRPAYSSLVSFAFHQNWLVVANSATGLEQIVFAETLLRDEDAFFQKNYLADRSPFLRMYFVSETLLNSIQNPNAALFKTLGQLVPRGVISAKMEHEKVRVKARLQTLQGAFLTSPKAMGKPVIPELAQFADKESFFFINGTDLSRNYLHTQEFLASLHPQLALIFDGVFRAEAQRVFGPKFDFSADFLSKMHGQYALILDYSDPLLPLPKLVLVTGFGSSDTAKKLADFHETLRHGQGKFATKIQEVELPDGTTREELVATDPREIVINQTESVLGNFYTVENELSTAEIAYGFLQNYFVFSTDKTAVEQIFAKNLAPLHQFEGFRNMVLFSDPAESYGVIDTAKLAIAKEQVIPAETPVGQLVDMIAQKYQKVFFQRDTHADSLDWNFVLE